MFAHRAAELGARDPEVDRAILDFLFATVTNVDFDPERLRGHLLDAAKTRDRAKTLYEDACAKAGKTPEALNGPAAWQPAADLAGLVRQGEDLSLTKRQARLGNDVTGLQELILYGLKGAAAYADHARILGYEDPDVYATFHAALDFLTQENPASDALLDWVMKAGELNLTVMGLLDAANTSTYGHPEPTSVRVTPVRGKCICVSGHDLKDLDELLKQTEGKGINVYTHGEMLPCHAYPGLKKYKHLVGNYGGAWQDQRTEFERVSRRDPDDHQLHPEAQGKLPGPHFHQRAGGLAGRAPHRAGPRFLAGDRGRAGRSRASPTTPRSRRSPSASAITPCWAWPKRSSPR